jgi:hypothetical protein
MVLREGAISLKRIVAVLDAAGVRHTLERDPKTG